MKKTTLMIGVAALVMALFASTALAQGRRGRGQGPPADGEGCRGAACMIEQLGLDEQQMAAVEALREEHLERLETLQAEAQAAREEMQALAEDDTATVEDVELVEAKMIEAQQAIHSERRFFRTQVYEILTPEQQAQVPNAWRLGLDRGFGRHGWGNRHARMGHGRGRGPGAGQARHRRGWGRGWQGDDDSLDLAE